MKRAIQVFCDSGFQGTSTEDLLQGIRVDCAQLNQSADHTHPTIGVASFTMAFNREVFDGRGGLEGYSDSSSVKDTKEPCEIQLVVPNNTGRSPSDTFTTQHGRNPSRSGTQFSVGVAHFLSGTKGHNFLSNHCNALSSVASCFSSQRPSSPAQSANQRLNYRVPMVCNDGMAVMTHRTTFTLDGATVRRLKRLASRWKVSQAEVIRRAVAQAETQPDPLPADPVSMLRQLHESSDAIDPKRAESYLTEVYADRKRWRGR